MFADIGAFVFSRRVWTELAYISDLPWCSFRTAAQTEAADLRFLTLRSKVSVIVL